MATLGMKHAVLWVEDPETSADFYNKALGLEKKGSMPGAIFMSSPNSQTDHDLGLFEAASPRGGKRAVGLYHISWEVATLGELAAARDTLEGLGALVGASDHGVSRSLYCQDPDGIEFEIMWELPLELVDSDQPKTAPLDLEADIARFGADTPGRGAH